MVVRPVARMLSADAIPKNGTTDQQCVLCFKKYETQHSTSNDTSKLYNLCCSYLHSAITQQIFSLSDNLDSEEKVLPFCPECFESALKLGELTEKIRLFQRNVCDLILIFSFGILHRRNARSDNKDDEQEEGKFVKFSISSFPELQSWSVLSNISNSSKETEKINSENNWSGDFGDLDGSMVVSPVENIIEENYIEIENVKLEIVQNEEFEPEKATNNNGESQDLNLSINSSLAAEIELFVKSVDCSDKVLGNDQGHCNTMMPVVLLERLNGETLPGASNYISSKRKSKCLSQKSIIPSDIQNKPQKSTENNAATHRQIENENLFSSDRISISEFVSTNTADNSISKLNLLEENILPTAQTQPHFDGVNLNCNPCENSATTLHLQNPYDSFTVVNRLICENETLKDEQFHNVTRNGLPPSVQKLGQKIMSARIQTQVPIDINVNVNPDLSQNCASNLHAKNSHNDMAFILERRLSASETFKETQFFNVGDIRNNIQSSGQELFGKEKNYSRKMGWKCPHCENAYASKEGLDGHVKRAHTKEKRFHCSLCEKKFVCNGDLKIHFRTHTGEKPFECKFCAKRFAIHSNLTEHTRQHTGEFLRCPICNAMCSRRSHLSNHMKLHRNIDKSYECNQCEYSSKFINRLTIHQRTHLPKCYFKCRECEEQFKEESTAVDHYKQVHFALDFSDDCIIKINDGV